MMSDCYEKAIITDDMDNIVQIITLHTALAVAEAMMLESVESIPSLQEV